jgi:hypothetical protein
MPHALASACMADGARRAPRPRLTDGRAKRRSGVAHVAQRSPPMPRPLLGSGGSSARRRKSPKARPPARTETTLIAPAASASNSSHSRPLFSPSTPAPTWEETSVTRQSSAVQSRKAWMRGQAGPDRSSATASLRSGCDLVAPTRTNPSAAVLRLSRWDTVQSSHRRTDAPSPVGVASVPSCSAAAAMPRSRPAAVSDGARPAPHDTRERGYGLR